MIAAIITIVLAYGVIQIFEKKNDGVLDGYSIATFVVVPAIVSFFLTIADEALGLAGLLALASYLLYFIVPTLMCRLQAEYSWGRSCAYGGIVFGCSLVTAIGFTILMAGA
jgi:hypothetical protein